MGGRVGVGIQFNRERSAAAGGIADFHRSPMGLQGARDNRQSQSRTIPAALIGPPKALKDKVALLRRNSGAVVFDLYDSVFQHLYNHGRSRWRVFDGVFRQIANGMDKGIGISPYPYASFYDGRKRADPGPGQ